MLKSLAILGAVIFLPLAGCSSTHESEVIANSPTTSSASKTPNLDYSSKWKPLDTGSPGGDAEPFLTHPSLGQIEKSKVDRTRSGAERFAVLVATTYIDSRKSTTDPEKFINDVTSKDFPGTVRAHLIDDMILQRRGTLRHFADDSPGWLRSIVVGGGEASPRRVNVEISGYVVSEPFGVHSWYRTRYDIIWQSGRWVMVDFSDGKFGPDDTKVSSSSQASKLWGPGWRLIPAAIQ